MTNRAKVFIGCATSFILSILCVCTTTGGLGWRYFSSGINPLREIRAATLGESIEIKESRHGPHASRVLMVDAIDRGLQFTEDKRDAQGVPLKRQALTYWHAHGPVGVLMEARRGSFGNPYDGDARLPLSVIGSAADLTPWSALGALWSQRPFGVIMLDNGSLAAYARPCETLDIYERSSQILQLSWPKDARPPTFSFVTDAQQRGVHVRVFEGNERKAFDKNAPKGFYHLLFLETSHGHPALPAKELMTQEALQSFFSAMVEDGIVCFHTSSRSFDLTQPLAATCNALKFHHTLFHDPHDGRDHGKYTSQWLLVARRRETLEKFGHNLEPFQDRHLAQYRHLPNFQRWRLEMVRVEPGQQPWTDAGSNSLSHLKR